MSKYTTNKQLVKELSDLMNMHSVDNELNTPDFILAQFLIAQLKVYEETTKCVNKWNSREDKDRLPDLVGFTGDETVTLLSLKD